LLEELLVLIHQENEPPVSPEPRLKTLTVKDYWVWLSILGFLLAWSVYQFNPFY
ncbi:hypothetical protein BMETH_24281161652, partial [methanotrophic bacterial endosymbiont of Bathymodiolus sp.]